MATIKSYSDLQQSKKLAEILPLESADMYLWSSGKRYYIEAMDDGDFNEEEGHVRAWSLAALLGVLQEKKISPDISTDKLQMWYCECWDIDGSYISYTKADNLVDACVAMIEKLNELNLL